jgi:hypothetical protein
MSDTTRPPWDGQPLRQRPPTIREQANAIIDYGDECPESGWHMSLRVFGVEVLVHDSVDLAALRAELHRAAVRWLEEQR